MENVGCFASTISQPAGCPVLGLFGDLTPVLRVVCVNPWNSRPGPLAIERSQTERLQNTYPAEESEAGMNHHHH